MPEADGAIELVSCAIANVLAWEKLDKTPHAPLGTGHGEAARHVTSLTRSAAPAKTGPQNSGLWLGAALRIGLVGDLYDCPAVPPRRSKPVCVFRSSQPHRLEAPSLEQKTVGTRPGPGMVTRIVFQLFLCA
jgi:hypothetical protein